MEPTIGRIVRVVLDDAAVAALGGNHVSMGYEGRIAAAVIVRHWGGGCVNLKVLGDSQNDIWLTSVGYYEQVPGAPLVTRTWHWPARD